MFIPILLTLPAMPGACHDDDHPTSVPLPGSVSGTVTFHCAWPSSDDPIYRGNISEKTGADDRLYQSRNPSSALMEGVELFIVYSRSACFEAPADCTCLNAKDRSPNRTATYRLEKISGRRRINGTIALTAKVKDIFDAHYEEPVRCRMRGGTECSVHRSNSRRTF